MGFRFYVSYTNRRGNTNGSSLQEGSEVHSRGWNAGVKVYPTSDARDGKRDAFAVYMSYGSNGRGTDILLGTVTDTPDGPRFTPVDGLLGLDSAPEWVSYDRGDWADAYQESE